MTEENSMSTWFQDNLRIIISIGIVVLLVFAIYSYSKRNSRTDIIVDDSKVEEIATTTTDGNNTELNEIIDEIKDEEENTDNLSKNISAEQENIQEPIQDSTENKVAPVTQEEVVKKIENEENATEQKQQSAKDVVKEVIESRSRQKEGVTVIVAIPKDSKTTMARKATAEYIRANNITGLTPAHKIYIEDYIQKATNAPRIHPGTELDFSNTLINSAIEKSRTLTSNQLSNLDKYAQNVSIL
jgi:hypothetical protein